MQLKNRRAAWSPAKLQKQLLQCVLREFDSRFETEHSATVCERVRAFHQNRSRHPVQTVLRVQRPQTHHPGHLRHPVPSQNAETTAVSVQVGLLLHVLLGLPTHHPKGNEAGGSR